jgi:hypothetical protein
MLSQRVILRPLQQFAARGSPFRPMGRRGFKMEDNAFNRERAAVKAHAAGSAGMCDSYAGIWSES